MKAEKYLKLQAWLDGELPGSEEKGILDWLATDAQAQALLGELRATKSQLQGNEGPRILPLNGDFYWSRIQLEILRGHQPETARPARPSWLHWISRLLVPAGAAAMFGLLLVPLLKQPAPSELASFNVESSMPDSSVVAFHSEAEGITVVWIDSQ